MTARGPVSLDETVLKPDGGGSCTPPSMYKNTTDLYILKE